MQVIQVNDIKRGEGDTSELSRRPDQRSVVLHDRSSIVDHIFDNLLGGEDLVYLSSDATSEPWSGTKKLFGVLLDVIFDGEDTLVKEGLGLSLAVILPDEKKGTDSGSTDKQVLSKTYQSST